MSKAKPSNKKQDERKLKLQEAMKEINKKFKSEVLQYGNEAPAKSYIQLGIKEIDEFNGGLTRGNFSIIYGGESTGKSTYAIQYTAAAQRAGFMCCYIDLEHSFNVLRATEMGVNLKDLVLVSDANTAEQAMDVVIKLCREKVIDLFIIDSVQAMSPEMEQFTKKGKEMSMSDDSMALLARKLGQFFRICATPVYQASAAVLLIGQVRTAGIGGFATRDGLSGGHALMHWAYQIMYMRRGQKADAPVFKTKEKYIDNEGDEATRSVDVLLGFDCVMKLEKNKSSASKPEGTQLHHPFYFKSGFLPEQPVTDEKDQSDDTSTKDS